MVDEAAAWRRIARLSRLAQETTLPAHAVEAGVDVLEAADVVAEEVETTVVETAEEARAYSC